MADMNNVVFPRKLLKKFIALYKELPCLWDKNCIAYKHKQKRHDAASKLTKLVQEYDPSATRVHILRKIESLRACARREHKRVKNSRKHAANPDEVYVPQLWYYDTLCFIFGENDNVSRVKLPIPEPEIEEEENEEDDHSYEQGLDNNYPDYSVASMIEVTNNIPMPQQYNYEDTHNKSNNRQCTEIQDEYDAIGINVAAKLRSLPANMRILAEKLINDVLFQAQINGLNSSTVISTSDPFKQDIM